MRQGAGRLVGRDRELDEVRGALRRSAAGKPTVVLVRGEAGVGKTRLVGTVLAGRESERTVVGHCTSAIAGETPFAPLVDAVRDVLQAESPQHAEALLAPGEAILASVFPELSKTRPRTATVAGAWERTRLVSALVDLIFRLAQPGPTVLVMEDVHWADRETAQVLTVLARRLQGQQLGVVLTWREDEHVPVADRDWLVEMQRLPTVTDVALERLDRVQAGVLLDELLDAPVTRSRAEWVLDLADGNPYAVVELARAVQLGTTAVPATLTELALSRLRGITPESWTLVELLAAARRPLSEDILATASGLGAATAPALRELLDRQAVVRAGGDEFALRHAILAEAVGGVVTPSQRRGRHDQLATALSTAEPAASAADVAGHWIAARRWPEALQWTVRAAAEASAVYGFAASAEHLERAAQMWDRVPDAESITGASRWQLLTDATIHWTHVARFDDANRIPAAAVDEIRRQRPPEAALLLAMHAEMFFHVEGDTAAAIPIAHEAIALAEHGPDDLFPVVAARVSKLLLNAGMDSEALQIAERRNYGRAAPPELLAARGGARVQTGDVRAGVEDLERAMSGAGDLLTRCRVAMMLTDALWRLNESSRVVEVGLPVLAEVRAAGVWGEGAPALLWNIASCLMELGRLEEAAQLLAPEVDRPVDYSNRVAYFPQARLVRLRGEFDSAARVVESLRGLWGTNIPEIEIELTVGEVEVALGRDHPEEVAGIVGACLSRTAGTSEAWQLAELGWLAARAGADLAVAARRSGRDADAERAVEEIDRIADALPEPARRAAPGGTGVVVEGFNIALAAERSRAVGDNDPASWRAARDTWHTLRQPVRELYAGFRLAESLAQHGALPDAQTVLAATDTAAAEIGLRALRADLAAVARRYRLRAGAFETGDGPLTSRELDVLALIATGCSNAEIGKQLYLSTSTVRVHTSNILRKLGVRTRTEAAALAYRRGLLPVAPS